MDILQLVPTIYGRLILFILIFARISTLLTTFIILRQELITGRIIIAVSALLSIYVLAGYSGSSIAYTGFSVELLIELLFQILIGFLTATALNIIFEVFIAVGQIISMQIGLGMASLIDPRFGFITSLTTFYIILSTLIFLFLNGHLFVIKMAVDSFNALPLYHEIISKHLLHEILNYAGIIFSSSIMLSMAVIVTIFLTNISVAVMTKFAPQFNLFTIGINLELVIGLLCVYLTFYLFFDNASAVIIESLQFIGRTFAR